MPQCRLACRLLVVATLAGAMTVPAIGAEELRTWTIKTGAGQRKLTARLVGLKQGAVALVDAKGKQTSVPLADLADEDRKEALIRRVGSSVVVIQIKDVYDQVAGVGSGFVIRRDGCILTNYHVVRGAGSIEVEFRDDPKKHAADCLAVDPANDVAMIRVADVPSGVHVLELSPKTLPKAGDSVWTIGHPKGLKNTVSWGDVNAVRKTSELPEELIRFIKAPATAPWVQTDAVLAQGSSGGPLLDAFGQAVGINTFLVGPQLGFAIHVGQAKGAFEQGKAGQPLELPMAPGEHESALAWVSRPIASKLKEWKEATAKLQSEVQSLGQEAAVTKSKELNRQFAQDFLELARPAPASWAGLQALYFTCKLARDGSDDSVHALARACELLNQHHAASKNLGAVVADVADVATDEARSFCLNVIENSPHEATRGQAIVGFAVGRTKWLAAGSAAEFASLKAARQDIEAMIARLEKDYAKTEVNGSTGAELAEQLKELLTSVRIGAPAQEIKGVDMKGEDFKLSDYKGKVVLLDFFADWCPYCRKMYPSERRLVETMQKRPFALLGVNSDNQKKLEAAIDSGAVTWRTWADGEQGPITASWGVESFPCLFLIDHTGLVQRSYNGVPDEKELAETIEKLVAKAEKELAAAK